MGGLLAALRLLDWLFAVTADGGFPKALLQGWLRSLRSPLAPHLPQLGPEQLCPSHGGSGLLSPHQGDGKKSARVLYIPSFGIALPAQHHRLCFLGSRRQKKMVLCSALDKRKASAVVHAAAQTHLAHSFLHTFAFDMSSAWSVLPYSLLFSW